MNQLPPFSFTITDPGLNPLWFTLAIVFSAVIVIVFLWISFSVDDGAAAIVGVALAAAVFVLTYGIGADAPRMDNIQEQKIAALEEFGYKNIDFNGSTFTASFTDENQYVKARLVEMEPNTFQVVEFRD